MTGPLAAALTLASGVDLTLGLSLTPMARACQRFAPTVGLSAAFGQDGHRTERHRGSGPSIGAHPAVTALPELECHARYGAGKREVDDHRRHRIRPDGEVVVQVGALRAGIGLDASRRLVFVLAADRVVLGPSASPATHDVLDLTSPDALAEVGGEALSSVLGGLIAGLGAPARGRERAIRPDPARRLERRQMAGDQRRGADRRPGEGVARLPRPGARPRPAGVRRPAVIGGHAARQVGRRGRGGDGGRPWVIAALRRPRRRRVDDDRLRRRDPSHRDALAAGGVAGRRRGWADDIDGARRRGARHDAADGLGGVRSACAARDHAAFPGWPPRPVIPSR